MPVTQYLIHRVILMQKQKLCDDNDRPNAIFFSFFGMVILVAFKTDADLIDNVNELDQLAIQVIL